jgi:hypothetical protein
MTGIRSLELRGAVGVAASALGAAAWGIAPRLRLDRPYFRRLATVFFAVTRLGMFALAFWVIHLQPRGDISLYMQEAAPAYAGRLVYRDFVTPHAPLSPYMLAGMLHIHYAATTIIFFAILFDIAAFALWMIFSGRALDALTERRAALLMIFNASSILTVAIDGQMNALIALGLAWGAVALLQRRDFVSGLVSAIPGVTVKFLAWIFAPSLFFASRRKLFWVLGFVALTAAVYAGCAATGANILVPLKAEGSHKTSSSLIYLFELLTGHDLGDRLPDLLLGLSWLGFAVALPAWAFQRRRNDETATLRILALGMLAALMCVQVFSKNTWDRYLVMAMYPLCYLVAQFSWAEIGLYSLWSVVNVVYRSYWATVANAPVAAPLHHTVLHGDPVANWVLVGEVLQTGGNVYILLRCVQRLVVLGRGPQTQARTEEIPPGIVSA